jgi:ketol-acid reductoisomerase
MTTRYFDRDADLGVLADRRIAVIGYGNQGRAQALNLRDGGFDVRVGTIDDPYRATALADGMEILEIPDAVADADVVLMLVPDEVQAEVYEQAVAPSLAPGSTLVWASGFAIAFGLVDPPPDHDVVMVAPRQIGDEVRRSFADGRGHSCFLAVHNDASGGAMQTALAIACAIGGTRAGALASTFLEEAVLDLYVEQVLAPRALEALFHSFEALVAAGFDPEVVQLELYGSGEAITISRYRATEGVIATLGHESPTARYGTLSTLQPLLSANDRSVYERGIEEILSGSFARRWSGSGPRASRMIEDLLDQIRGHPMLAAEASNLAAEGEARAG